MERIKISDKMQLDNGDKYCIIEKIFDCDSIDENLKNTNPLEWTGIMNNYKQSVEEIIYKELIYV